MRLKEPVRISELATLIGAQQIIGDESLLASGINEIHKVQEGDVTFVDVAKYFKKCLTSQATIIIINEAVEAPEGKVLLVHPEPFEAYKNLVNHFAPFQPSLQTISSMAYVHPTALIMPGVYLGNNVRIGAHSIIHPNTVIYDNVQIGEHVIVHANTVIGGDAFYYKGVKGREVQYDKWPSCGEVVIEDWVEIGASCTIDKGVSGTTRIGKGTKIDNLVHVAHGVEIGKNCLIAAQVGIAGKTIIKDHVTLWGQVGVNKDLTIGEGTTVYAQSGVPASVEAGKVYFGSPVMEAKEKMKELAWMKRLPIMWQKMMGKGSEE
jgi:UDP-3-O-[3-hydroxymyristoyl] glucosamine N-acyltransferase